MSTNAALRSAQFSEQEWEARCHLAACYRLFVRYGWTDLIHTHISARHPVNEGEYLINPYGLLFEEITASSLIVVDWQGNVLRGDYPCNEAGHAIHSAVLQARPDVNWVLHTHTRAGMAVSCMKCGLLPLTQQAMFFRDYTSYHAWDVQTEPGECERMTEDLGPRNHILILNNHGLLTCAPTIGEAFTTLYTVETACKVQVDVLRSGAEIVLPDDAALARTAEVGAPGAHFARTMEWDAMLRWLDRHDPSYKT